MLKASLALALFSIIASAIPSPLARPWVRKIKHTVEHESHDKAAMDAFFEASKELLTLHMNCEESGGLSIMEGVTPMGCYLSSNRWLCAHQGSVVCVTYFESGLSPQKRTEGLIGFATGERWIGNRTPNPAYDFGPLKARYLQVYKK